jgi:hypothetical protein
LPCERGVSRFGYAPLHFRYAGPRAGRVPALEDDAAGEQLTALLKDHILIAAEIVTAAKGGDTAKLESSKQRR